MGMRDSYFKVMQYPWCEWISLTLFLWGKHEILRNNSVFGIEYNTTPRNEIAALG